MRFKLSVVLCLSLIATSLLAEDEPPSVPTTDIVIIPIETSNETLSLAVDELQHVTQRKGYDNQPHFSADGRYLYFTRMLDQQTDIHRYDLKEKTIDNITQTETISEYSPTVYDDYRLSMIGVNSQGQQHLRWLNLESGQQTVLNPAIEPVGYHAWLHPELAAVFVLGEVMTLQLLEPQANKAAKPLADNIGRCLQPLPDQRASFTLADSDGLHTVYTVNSQGQIAATGIRLPAGVQDYVWWDEQGVLVGTDSEVWYISNKQRQKVADLSALTITTITRLAIDEAKSRLALVYNPPY